MATEDKDKKREEEIQEEKKFLQARWKAIKDEEEKDDKSKEDNKEEKSYISYRWKALKKEEEDLKSLISNKKITPKNTKSVSNAVNSFTKKFNRSKKYIQETQKFLKELAETDTEDYDNTKKLKSFHYHRKMGEVIGDLAGNEDEEEGQKALAKALILYKDFKFDEMKQEDKRSNVTVGEPGKSKYSGNDPLQQFGDGGSLVNKKEFSESHKEGDKVNLTRELNDPKIAKLGEDDMPFYEGSHILKDVKGFSEADEEQSRINLTKPGSPSHYNPGKESMQQFGVGGTLVKLLKSVNEASTFLKYMAYEKAFGYNHRVNAERLAKALADDLDMTIPFVAQLDEDPIAGSLGWLLQEEEEPEHKKKKDKKEKALGDMPLDDATDMDTSHVGEIGGMEGLDEENEPGMDMGGMRMEPGKMLGQKALDSMYNRAIQESQMINEMAQSLNNLLSQI